ncbi:MAG TPA: hypothetical protein VHO06_04970 [Polyangia bacterium]|nr:hypothetical protein [Polyangia bacterium]
MNAAKARTDLLEEERAALVDQTSRQLDNCVQVARLRNQSEAYRASHRKCPCTEGDVTWTDEDAAVCGVDIQIYYQTRHLYDSRRIPETDPNRQKGMADYLGRLRSCVLAAHARSAQKQALADLDSRGRQAIADGKVSPCYRREMGDRWAGLFVVNGPEAPRFLTPAEKYYWKSTIPRAVEECRAANLADQFRNDPDVVQVVASGNLCDARSKRADAEREISSEKRYSKRAGVVNLSKLESLKDDLKEQDGRISRATAKLNGVNRKPLQCSDARLKTMQACYSANGDGELPVACSADAVQAEVTLFGEDD